MIRMAFRLLLLCVLCSHSLEPSAADAQAPVALSPPATSPNDEKAAPGLRVLDLIALDKNGRAVNDLKPEELQLFDDKAEQKIISLSANEPLTIGLFFDISGSRRADQYVREETRLTSEFVHSIWRHGDTAFLLTFDNEAYVDIQPTQSLEAMDAGLRQIPGQARVRRLSTTLSVL
jgi:hypothetical protein